VKTAKLGKEQFQRSLDAPFVKVQTKFFLSKHPQSVELRVDKKDERIKLRCLIPFEQFENARLSSEEGGESTKLSFFLKKPPSFTCRVFGDAATLEDQMVSWKTWDKAEKQQGRLECEIEFVTRGKLQSLRDALEPLLEGNNKRKREDGEKESDSDEGEFKPRVGIPGAALQMREDAEKNSEGEEETTEPKEKEGKTKKKKKSKAKKKRAVAGQENQPQEENPRKRKKEAEEGKGSTTTAAAAEGEEETQKAPEKAEQPVGDNKKKK